MMDSIYAFTTGLLSAFTYVDLLVVAVVIGSTIMGLVRGGFQMAMSFLCWLIGLSAAIYITPLILPNLPITFKSLLNGYVVIGFVVFVIVLFFVKLFAYVFNKFIFPSGPTTSGMIIGSLLGLLRGHIIISVLYFLLVYLWSQPVRAVDHAYTTQYVADYTRWAIYEALPEIAAHSDVIIETPTNFVEAFLHDDQIREALQQLHEHANAILRAGPPLIETVPQVVEENFAIDPEITLDSDDVIPLENIQEVE
ncbi:MAG: CvpA family protein [Pseudomonadota bacterium]